METLTARPEEWRPFAMPWKTAPLTQEDEMEPNNGILSPLSTINFNMGNVQEIIDMLQTASQATNQCLLNECDVIYECRACTNLFRSLANFVSHKRHFCKEHRCETMMAFGNQSAVSLAKETQEEEEEDDDDESLCTNAQSSSSMTGEEEASLSSDSSDEESGSISDRESVACRESDLDAELGIKKESLQEEMEESPLSSREEAVPADVLPDEDITTIKKELNEENEATLPETTNQPAVNDVSRELTPPPEETTSKEKRVESEESSIQTQSSSPTKVVSTGPKKTCQPELSKEENLSSSSPEKNSSSQAIAIDGKAATTLGKTFKNCTLKLPRGIMEKLFVPVDNLGQSKEEGGDTTKRGLSIATLTADGKADGTKPMLSKLATGKRFAILNPQLFAKLIKENSKPFKMIQTTPGVAELKKQPEGIKPNHTEEKNSLVNSTEPIRLKVSKFILEPQQNTSKESLENSSTSTTATTVPPTTNLKAREGSNKVNGLPSEAGPDRSKRSSSCESDEYKDIKKLFIDSDAENSDMEEGKQEKKPLIVVISKSSKEQMASLKAENGEHTSEACKQKKIYTCEQCTSTFCSKKTLDSHAMIVHEKKRLMYPCPFCEATLGQAWSVMRHIMAIHKRPKEEYDSLKKVIKKNSYYKEIDPNEPMEYEEGEGYPIGSLKCSTCYKPFDKRNALSTHERYCSKPLSKPTKKENVSPVKEEPKDNATLSPKSSSNSLIDANLNVHSRPKRVPNKKEFKDYINSQTLKLNYISKTSPAPPKVTNKSASNDSPTNGPVTKQFSKMEASMMDILNLHNLECLRCKKTFNNTSNLKRHAASHFGWCRFGCSACPYKTYNKSDCKMHIMKTHKEDDPDKLIVTLSDFKTKISAAKLPDSPNINSSSETAQKRPADENQQSPTERKKKRKNSQTFKSAPSQNDEIDQQHSDMQNEQVLET